MRSTIGQSGADIKVEHELFCTYLEPSFLTRESEIDRMID